ncbi:MAG: hypothetical protein ACK6CU_29810, partial [Deltaproteobacteria bacterium]
MNHALCTRFVRSVASFALLATSMLALPARAQDSASPDADASARPAVSPSEASPPVRSNVDPGLRGDDDEGDELELLPASTQPLTRAELEAEEERRLEEEADRRPPSPPPEWRGGAGARGGGPLKGGHRPEPRKHPQGG